MRVQKSRPGLQLRPECSHMVLHAKSSDNTENCDPNMPHAVEESPTKDINFSRKRPLTAVKPGDEAAGGTPKRIRSTQQLNTDCVATPPLVQTLKAQRKPASPAVSLSRRRASIPGRNSKFKEASMHDRVSDKPPSMFMRMFGGGSDHGAKELDSLMEQYHNKTDTAPILRPVTRQGQAPRPVTRQTQLAGLTHHANASISESSVRPMAPESGIFRFGRSLASAFNPFKAWKSMSRSFKNTEEAIPEETLAQAAEDEWTERRAQVEAAYQELKRSGQIPTKIVARPVTSMGIRPGDRESGNQLSSARSSTDMRTHFHEDGSTTGSYIDARERPESRKSAFHVHRPSLNDLKSLPSQLNISNGRTPSSKSPEKPTKAEGDFQQSSLTKKHLAKQQKLTKQVSDLEAKLDKVRTELHSTMSEAKPLPGLPVQPEVTQKGTKSPHKSFSITRRARNSTHLPALESIPSERLLLKKGNVANSSELSFQCQGASHPQQRPMLDSEPMDIDEPRLSMSERSFLSDPSDDEAGTENTPKASKDTLMSELATAQVVMLHTPAPAKIGRRVTRPSKGAAPDRSTRELRASKKGKSSRQQVAASHQKPAALHQPVVSELSSAEPVKSHGDDAEDPVVSATHAFAVPNSNDASTTSPAIELPLNRPLSVVAEETASIIGSIAVKLNDEPERPTAVKTPAVYHPRRSRGPCSSPDEGNVTAALGPSPGRGPGSPFQWPEDCF